MKKPNVIAINGVSGAGKTALTDLLATTLPNTVHFHFDDFEASNVYPDDFYEWANRGADLSKFDCPGLASAVEEEIRDGSADFIVLDYPFGREHPRLKDCIDYSVFIDTPLDVAMARRILRDGDRSTMSELKEELEHYIRKARHAYLDAYRHRAACDLILDGWNGLPDLCEKVIEQIRSEPIGRGSE